MIEIGSEGLAEVDLIIPQGTTFGFTVVHKDQDGNVIDHSGSTVKATFMQRGETIDVSPYCDGGTDGISVAIPPSVTGKLNQRSVFPWDMVVSKDGVVTRLLYGHVKVAESYAEELG